MLAPDLAIDSADVAGHYDDLDEYYRLLWGEHLHHGYWETGREPLPEAIENLIRRVVRPLELAPGAAVCDVGCGYGGTSRFLAAEHGFRMTGLTISPRQHAYALAKSGGAGNPLILLRNWEENELDAASFDGLVSIECVAHVVNKERYFEEIRRVLKPGARACLTAWIAAEGAGPLAKRRLLEPICREGRLPAMGAPGDYRALAGAAGLRVLRYEDVTRRVRRTWRIGLRRMLGCLLFTPTGWRFLCSARSRHAIFAFSVARILVAYYTGSMRYGVLELEKPAE